MSPFVVLGIPETASPADVRNAWLELARVHHPDKGGDAGQFASYKSTYDAALKIAYDTPCDRCRGSGMIIVGPVVTFVGMPMICPTCSGLRKKYARP